MLVGSKLIFSFDSFSSRSAHSMHGLFVYWAALSIWMIFRRRFSLLLHRCVRTTFGSTGYQLLFEVLILRKANSLLSSSLHMHANHFKTNYHNETARFRIWIVEWEWNHTQIWSPQTRLTFGLTKILNSSTFCGVWSILSIVEFSIDAILNAYMWVRQFACKSSCCIKQSFGCSMFSSLESSS